MLTSNNYLSKNFKQAVKDFYYLLCRDYPQKATIKLIGDRYRLTGLERSVLLRGIIKEEIAKKRKGKKLSESEIYNKILVIDCYNVLFTISSYLSGKFFYIANDGFLRDASESHGKIEKKDIFLKILTQLFRYFIEKGVKRVDLYLDSPVSFSRELSKEISLFFKEYKIIGKSHVVKSADYYLINTRQGICVTSDSIIIDHKKEIFDLSFYFLKHYYSPDFFYLDSFLN